MLPVCSSLLADSLCFVLLAAWTKAKTSTTPALLLLLLLPCLACSTLNSTTCSTPRFKVSVYAQLAWRAVYCLAN
jgi:hypothetical protein